MLIKTSLGAASKPGCTITGNNDFAHLFFLPTELKVYKYCYAITISYKNTVILKILFYYVI